MSLTILGLVILLPDLINASFELVGAGLTWLNLKAYSRSRKVEGVYWPTTAFFGAWGLWNCLYYPFLGQWLSFAAGILLALGNMAWVGWVMFDKWKARKHEYV